MSLVERVSDALDLGVRLGEARHESRLYLGASIVGHACEAYISLAMRGFPSKRTPRLQRAAALGRHLERMVIDDLKRAGVRVMEADRNGDQFSWSRHNGWFRGHADGIAAFTPDDPILLEVKSAKHSRFSRMKKHGVKKSDRMYYDQVTAMMGMSGMTRTLFIAVDKDTGETHVEVIEFDAFHWAYLQTKIDRILFGRVERISNDPNYWRCLQCDQAENCRRSTLLSVRGPFCNQCKNARYGNDGSLLCNLTGAAATGPCISFDWYTPDKRK